MKESGAYHVSILGMTGCGKSTLTNKIASDRARRIVFDYVEEWEGPYIYVNSSDEFSNVWRENFHKPSFTIIVRFDFSAPDKEIIETVAKILTLVYLTGKNSNLDVTIIAEEAHFYFPNHGLHPVMRRVVTTGRHAHMNLIVNTQRPAELSKLMVSQSREVYTGQLFEINDLMFVRETMGREAENIVRALPRMEFLYFPIGKPDEMAIIELPLPSS